MNKLWIVIRREYLQRVRHRLFLVTTFLIPLLLVALMVLPALFASGGSNENFKVYVIDPTGEVAPLLQSSSTIVFETTDLKLEEAKGLLFEEAGETTPGILQLPTDLTKKQVSGTFYSAKEPSIGTTRDIRSEVRRAVRTLRLTQLGVEVEDQDYADVELELSTKKLTEEGEKKTSAILATAVGYGMAMLIYFMTTIYGSLVMQGVIEEKQTRIVEVIISTMRPIKLMMGKILGIGLVGLTQFALWVIVGAIGLFYVLPLFIGSADVDPAATGQVDPSQAEEIQYQVQAAIEAFDASIIPLFILYFIGGFLTYGALFAAVGSTVDNPQEGSQLTIVILMPLIIPLIALGYIIQNPSSTLSIVLSQLPLTSSMVMMVRVAATTVPFWQILTSLLLMVGGLVFFGWLSAKIFRTGILLHGKKYSLKEIAKWLRRS